MVFSPGGSQNNRQTAAVDVHYGMMKTLDYYLNVRQRNGIDGANLRIAAAAHYGDHYNNANWNAGGIALFGDGNLSNRGPLTSVDVVGHEITHGVTQKSAHLGFTGESGAANESFSDIFGTAVEWYVRAQQGQQGNYLVGEDTSLPTPGVGIRNLANPPSISYTYDPDGPNGPIVPVTFPFPDHLDKEAHDFTVTDYWDGGVHENSTIQSKAFYLLAEGGTHPYSDIQVTGIGRDAAERIFYAALTSTDLALNSQLFYHDSKRSAHPLRRRQPAVQFND